MRSKLAPHSHTLCSLTALLALATAPTTESPAIAATSAETPTVRVENAWIRWLPAGVPEGGYATLTNTGEKAATLIAASSPDYREVSIHRSVEQGGTLSMVPVQKITINPHSTVDFAATGYHFMLMQPSKAQKPGDHVPITLRFAEGALTVQFEVRK
jgi:periplasmic copper chaperone A